MSDLTEVEKEAIRNIVDGTADVEDWETVRDIETQKHEELTKKEKDV